MNRSLPAQAEGSMPVGLRKLSGVTTQVTGQLNEQVITELSTENLPMIKKELMCEKAFWFVLV